MNELVRPVILSGGAGTRLWPVSRESRPKQMHALTGTETMLQLTALRNRDAALFAPPLVVASERHAEQVEQQLADVGIAPAALLLEPVGRNTAAAIALAALEADAADLLLVLPSDHRIGRPDLFHEAVRAAVGAARADHLITFGIAPHHPETGYGYIRRGAPLAEGVYRVDRFVEKPDRATAQRYLDEGGYDWNGGIFLFRAGAMLDALAAHAPDILESVEAARAQGARHGVRRTPDAAAFARVRSQSIDHAVLEVHDRVAVVPVAMDWSDVGSWDALYELADKDADGNHAHGAVLARDSRGCLLHSDGPLIAAVGVTDLVVIATRDAVVVLPRGESQRVKEVVDALRTERHPALSD